MVTFAALRFAEDENIAHRTYWYRAPFPVREGDHVFAPVGSRNGLQRALVERVVETGEEDAPYDLRLVKCVTARCGACHRRVGEHVLTEWGGIAYDGKRFTRFGRLLTGEHGPLPRGYTAVDAATWQGALASLPGHGCAVLSGREGEQAALLLVLLAGARPDTVRAELRRRGSEAFLPADGREEAIALLHGEGFSAQDIAFLTNYLH